jgi:RNA polymerase sigma-70 factor, ECF subfamily
MDRHAEAVRAAGATRSASAAPTFEDLFAGEHERLFRALYLMTGNSQEAEELMQDAFLKIWERWDRVAAMDEPGGYLYRTAVNLARNRLRRLALAARRTLVPGQAEDPFTAADLRDEMVRALRGLGERQRMALVLSDLVGLSSEEASSMLGVKPATVRSLASQGRAALKRTMEARDG